MPKYVIEREMPAAGKLTPEQLRTASQKSTRAMAEIGQMHWVQTYLTDDKIYCIYVAPDEETIWRHARQADLPVDRVSRIRTLIDAACAE